jgi:hypothetical protein
MIYDAGKGKQNPFIISYSTSANTLNDANRIYYFAGQGAGYSSSASDRALEVLQPCIIKRAVYAIQQSTAGVQATNISGYVVNTTQNLSGLIFTSTGSLADNNFYEQSNTNLNIPCNQGDNIVCAISNTSPSVTNLRSIVYLYCY